MPVLVRDVVQAVAVARGTTAEAIVQTVQENLLELIRDDRPLSDARAFLEAWQSGG
jgi:hypothetical protein